MTPVTQRERSSITKNVIDLEKDNVIVTLEIPVYNRFRSQGMTDEQIFQQISDLHDGEDED